MNAAYAEADASLANVPELGNRLFDALAAMRAAAPIYWSEIQQSWIVTGHEEVVEGFRGDLPLSAARLVQTFDFMPAEERSKRIPYMMQTLPQWIINMDPPGQPRLRRLMMKAFSRKVAEDQRPFVQQLVKEVLDSLDARAGQDVEFARSLSREIPQRVILRLMGLPNQYQSKMDGWVKTTTPSLGSFAVSTELLERCERVLLEMREAFSREIAKRRENPTDDFISALVTARDEGDQLSEEELLSICYVTLLAGHNTTANTIAMGTAALAQAPQVCDYIRDNPDKIGDIVMEIMRHIAMSTGMSRVAAQDFNWRGHAIKKGQFVVLSIAGANRDPQAFPDPDAFDPARPQGANMTFAPGMHFCIGHYIAKVQLCEFFTQLVGRFDIEMLDDKLDFGPSLFFRGLNTLNLRFHRRSRPQSAAAE